MDVSAVAAPPVLEVCGLRKAFGSLVAINDVSFSVRRGEVVGLIGPNGAGKTTLLRMLATLLRPTSGRAAILGNELGWGNLAIRRAVGYLPDFFNLYTDLTLRECLTFFGRAYGLPETTVTARVADMLAFVDLTDKGDVLIRHLSRGMVQRLGLAVQLVHDPGLLLLDEPASGLDPKARLQLRGLLKRLSLEGKTIVISSHILPELADFCSHVAILAAGRLRLFGRVDEVQQRLAGVRRVTVRILGDPRAASAVAEEVAGFRVVDVKPGALVAETKRGVESLAELNARLVSRGIAVVGLSEDTATLEELFMQISGQEGER
ncbi:MAG: ABC transporter ATP-binding protein [Lentisphaeria bacterium]